MKFTMSRKVLTSALLAAAVAAPAAAFAQDADPEQQEQRREEERAAQREQRAREVEQRQAERAAEAEAERAAAVAGRAAAQAAQEAQRVRGVVQPAVPGIPPAPNVWQVRPAIVQTEPQTYLGVSTRQLTPDVAAHVGDIPKGVGLIVSFLDAEGPAAKAGIKEHDVLVKLDDQWLVNPDQLGVLVRMQEAGASTTLTVHRKGEEEEIEVELVEKELPAVQAFGQLELAPLAVPGEFRQFQQLEGLPGFQGALAPQVFGFEQLDAERRRQIEARVEEAMKRLEEQLENGAMQGAEEQMQALREVLRGRQLDLERLRRDAARPDLFRQGLRSGGRLMITNDDMKLAMLNEDGEITLEVTDADGETVYEGPYPTEAQLEELPEAAREIIEQARQYLPQEGQEGQEEKADDEDEEDPEPSPEPAPRRVRV